MWGHTVSPRELGLPPKFTSWRQHQDSAILDLVESDNRIIGLPMATGQGKSLTYVTYALMTGARTVILVSTKALQDQLMDDFASVGMVSVKGRGAYMCKASDDRTTCEDGVCITGARCEYQASGCRYYDAIRLARQSRLVVTNYAFWYYAHVYNEGLGDTDVLVLDEAHDAPFVLADLLTGKIKLDYGKMYGLSPPTEDWDTVYQWAQALRTMVQVDVEEGVRDTKRRVELNRVIASLNHILEIYRSRHQDAWILVIDGGVVTWSPIFPDRYTEDSLFMGVSRVLLTSATLIPKTMDFLGITDYDWFVYPSIFPAANRPVIYTPTSPPIRVTYRIEPWEEKLFVGKIDAIIRNRLDRKGIIHAVSYKRADYILEHSQYRQHMISHYRGGIRGAVNKFKAAKPPAILISPAAETGYDFPGDQCEYQIIAKVPFPSTQDRLTKARATAIPDYINYLAMQRLIQMCGRGTRTERDRSEAFIVDGNVSWFIPKNKHLCPSWFYEAYQVDGTGSAVRNPIDLIRETKGLTVCS